MQNILHSYQFQFNFFWKYFEIWASLLTIEEEEREMNSSDMQAKINSFNTIVFTEAFQRPPFHPDWQCHCASGGSTTRQQWKYKWINWPDVLIKMIWKHLQKVLSQGIFGGANLQPGAVSEMTLASTSPAPGKATLE